MKINPRYIPFGWLHFSSKFDNVMVFKMLLFKFQRGEHHVFLTSFWYRNLERLDPHARVIRSCVCTPINKQRESRKKDGRRTRRKVAGYNSQESAYYYSCDHYAFNFDIQHIFTASDRYMVVLFWPGDLYPGTSHGADVQYCVFDCSTGWTTIQRCIRNL